MSLERVVVSSEEYFIFFVVPSFWFVFWQIVSQVIVDVTSVKQLRDTHLGSRWISYLIWFLENILWHKLLCSFFVFWLKLVEFLLWRFSLYGKDLSKNSYSMFVAVGSFEVKSSQLIRLVWNPCLFWQVEHRYKKGLKKKWREFCMRIVMLPFFCLK